MTKNGDAISVGVSEGDSSLSCAQGSPIDDSVKSITKSGSILRHNAVSTSSLVSS